LKERKGFIFGKKHLSWACEKKQCFRNSEVGTKMTQNDTGVKNNKPTMANTLRRNHRVEGFTLYVSSLTRIKHHPQRLLHAWELAQHCNSPSTVLAFLYTHIFGVRFFEREKILPFISFPFFILFLFFVICVLQFQQQKLVRCLP